MSLDIYLTTEEGQVHESNITHSLALMAGAARIYMSLWRPEKIQVSKAGQLIERLRMGLDRLRSERLDEFNASNGWGKREDLIRFTEEYLAACVKYPEANVSVSR